MYRGRPLYYAVFHCLFPLPPKATAVAFSASSPIGTHAPTRDASVTPVRFETARRVVPRGLAGRFLRVVEGRSRGFWARGPRWAAHAGVLGEIQVAPGPERFRAVGEAAEGWRLMGDGDEALRFYGGFSFRDDHRPKERWDAFPAALFHLPAVELDGEGDGPARLRVRVPLLGDAAGAAQRLAEAEADTLLEVLNAPPSPSGVAPSPVKTTLRAGDRGTWLAVVERTLQEIRQGRLSKAVLARTLDVDLAGRLDTVDVLLALWRQHSDTHAFLFEPRPGSWLMGAAPEALATLRDGRVTATAVAGSVRRGSHPEEDRALARSLLDSRKDRAEHRVVVEDMVARLEPLTRGVLAEAEPHVLTLARIQHLETLIEAEAAEEHPILALVEALHPTPAVCGMERDAARAFLDEAEPFHRGWYAGPVGWFDSEGEGHFVPALRTGVGTGDRWRLFAGAGIVEGSDPESEWEETAIKFVPVLRALAASGAEIEGVVP